MKRTDKVNKKFLLLLADKLDTIEPRDFCTTDFKKDALYYATLMPEFKRQGFIFADNDNEPGQFMPFYEGQFGLDAAMLFFNIDVFAAQHLFYEFETDKYGHSQKSIFESTRYAGNYRDQETPAWVAQRIRVWLNGG